MEAKKVLRVVAVSDTHNSFPQVPNGDIYIHCGDFTGSGHLNQILTFCGYLKSLPHKHKIVIAGNHDVTLDQKSFDRLHKQFQLEKGQAEKARKALKEVCTYLEHEYVEVEGIRIFGSPFTPEFYNWGFMYNQDEAPHIWDIQQDKIDILVTHGPPQGILDKVSMNNAVGCPVLLQLTNKLKPKYHLFGHIHEGYGQAKFGDTTYCNCSLKNLYYKLVNKPIVFDICPE